MYIICSIEVSDNDGKIIMGSWNEPVVFAVAEIRGNLYIEKAQSFEIPAEVPKIYK